MLMDRLVINDNIYCVSFTGDSVLELAKSENMGETAEAGLSKHSVNFTIECIKLT